MALPDSPKTRSEMYLDGIAKGSTSGIPSTPVTRIEMYLDYIARNGGGGGGGGGFKVTIEQTSETTFTSDKTSTEILDAASGGSVPYAVITGGGAVQATLPLVSCMGGEARFGYVKVSRSKVVQGAVIIDSNGGAVMEQNEFDGEPNQ